MQGRREQAPGRRVEGVDVLRGLAVFAVMLRHSWPNTFGTAGEVGVVTFFALSGFLITGLIMRDVTTFGRLRYGRFYVHRAVRLLPALFFYLVGYVVLMFVLPVGDPSQIPRTLLIAVTYTADLPGLSNISGSISHLWTLAVEEQFYLVWPILLTLAVRVRQVWTLVLLSAAGIMGAVVFALHHEAPNYLQVYTWPPSWAIAILIGAAAQLAGPGLIRIVTGARWRHVLFAVVPGVFLIAMCVYPNGKNDPHTYLLVGPLIAVAATLVTIAALPWKTVGAVFKPLFGLGTISYAAYLWNWPIQQWLLTSFPTHSRRVAVGAVVLTLIAAVVSWYLVERPAKRIRRAFDRHRARVADGPRQPAVVGAAGPGDVGIGAGDPRH